MLDEELAAHDDPWEVLGVSNDATDEEIRAAYLARVKEFPPDRATEFERVRDAYELLRDPRRRARYRLLVSSGGLELTNLVRGRVSPRRFVGPRFWLEALKRR